MDIDVQGARQIRDKIRDADPEDPLKAAFVDIFIEPPSIEELKRRLENRAEDAEETIRRRVQNAEKEMADRDLYRYRIVNADLETAYTEFEQIILKEQAEP
jgi:guanylate kinase